MKNTIPKINKYLNQRSNFLSWLFLVLAIEYLFLFSLETILPGFVTAVFNLNNLLILVLINWFLLILFSNKKEYFSHNFSITNGFNRVILIGLIVLVAISIIIVLYKATYWETLIYLVLVLVSGKFIYDYIKKQNL